MDLEMLSSEWEGIMFRMAGVDTDNVMMAGYRIGAML